MTQGKRIILNFLATYGRSLFSLVCGLFSGRWLLMVLGEVDYGLYGVVGGLTAFIAFFNNLMGGAVARYYAYTVGSALTKTKGEEGLESCRQWFTTAVMIHSVVPVVLMLVGYPMGVWAVENFLVIPPDRVRDCIWVWRYVCVSCFVGMLNVPFVAMYTAKQEIAEMTIYSVVQTAVNVCVLYYMVTHAGKWLVVYAACACLISAVPQIIMCVRAVCLFPECRFRLRYIRGWSRVKELFVFATLRFAGALTIMIQGQGMALITNKVLGPSRNAAMTIGNTLSGQAESLSGALDTAVGPAITNAYGAGEISKMHDLCFCACKFSTILMLIFALPLSLEVEEVMHIWLGTPPAFASSLCVCMLVCLVLEKICSGHWMAVFAVGKIGWYQLFMGICGLVVLPLALILALLKFDLLAVGIAFIVGKVMAVFIRLHFGRKMAGLSIRLWVMRIFLPLSGISVCALLLGLLSVLTMQASFVRIVVSTGLVEMVLVPLCWFFVLSESERSYMWSRIGGRFGWLKKKHVHS